MTSPQPHEGHELVEQTPGEAEVQIVLCPDGPLLVRGRPVILDADGTEVSRGRGTVALCRCGGSAIKPFCDGTHKVNGFQSQD
ncbi:CDGSH iron-sulfur domain-containing protein [Sanguibacter suarezii]|uniref:CDGSH iron-sulfur domain-containing protein n=1 Tax=Sanguibacter suarezii TaxID=60921 RepID=UPI00082F5E33|nr:CDGSH iron-sulfur domain-containing protein [Sanguibacter suarezii]